MSDGGGLYEELARAATRSEAPVLEVVATLVSPESNSDNLRVRALGSHLATLVTPAGKPIHVLALGDNTSDLDRHIEHLVATNPREGSEVVIYGGSDADAEVIDRVFPKMLMHPLVLHHRTAAGTLRGWPAAKAAKSPRASALRNVRRLSRDEVLQLQQLIAEHAEYFRRQRQERSRYFRATDARRAFATYGLVLAIGVMFALQLRWWPRVGGNAALENYILAMGALDGSRAFAGEWYRLISVGFLHGSFVHVGMNGVALYLLGQQMERTLGTARFLVLYVGSLIFASLASATFTDLSVGASGAIWGLLGAQASLAYRLPPILPESISERLKPLVKTNLLINVAISFAPFIDAAAHFGGGIAGAVIIASHALYRRPSKKENGPSSERTPRGTPGWVNAAAGVSVLLLILGVGTALVVGRPWRFGGL